LVSNDGNGYQAPAFILRILGQIGPKCDLESFATVSEGLLKRNHHFSEMAVTMATHFLPFPIVAEGSALPLVFPDLHREMFARVPRINLHKSGLDGHRSVSWQPSSNFHGLPFPELSVTSYHGVITMVLGARSVSWALESPTVFAGR
jgi:hypothetical protein